MLLYHITDLLSVKIKLEDKRMENKVNYFSAAFRDGRVYIAGKNCAAGSFCVHLLNQYYINDTAARLSVFIQYNLHISNTLKAGYLNPTDYVKAGEEILHILDTLSNLRPFALLPADDECKRIAALFTEENGEHICDYLRRRAKVGLIDEGAASLDVLPEEYDKQFFSEVEALLSDVTAALRFYSGIGEDITRAFKKLLKFISRLKEAERLDEAHLLPIAIEIFGQVPFAVKSEYVQVQKSSRSPATITARQIYFESYYSFILTDFFEGLRYGHYPRQCEICKRYFLMQSARRQKYCNGYSDITFKGKRLPCRKAGALKQNTEKSTDHPYISIYKSRTGSIRVDKSRGKITEEFAEAGMRLAKEHLARAKKEPEYAKKQYLADMTKDNLYAEIVKALNN